MSKKYLQELEPAYTPLTVCEEASRCLLCLDAPCSKDCPAGTDPGRFIRAVRFRNFKGAAEVVRENNVLGSICARVCPTERYCQKGCARSGIDVPIDIGRIQRFITDFEQDAKMNILKKGKLNGKKVAIVGSGPAGLQAAASLARLGYEINIYEKDAKAGGYLRYGIPEYRLSTSIVDKEIEYVTDLGVNIHLNKQVGKDISLEQLKKDNDAVIVAVGASYGKMLPKFENNPNVEIAVEFLKRVKDNKGKVDLPDNILVIGGGDVAMDVNVTLKLLGVKNISDVVYEEFCEFRASKKELGDAQILGVSIIDGYVPVDVDGKTVTFKHRVIPGEVKITADKIILAVGQYPDVCGLDGIRIVNGESDIKGYVTNDPKVYVAGDIAHLDKTVVAAVRTGKDVASLIHSRIGGR
ncbi:MAG: FAD-dependent oxidoreductase [Bacilli bacterium]|jgi:dihydropyrimidine dehydrogenase (NAD+) subunit PreT|nr:FAD-dependent oxidoreductase [Bacilli bacterium]